jgi:hypothetical protein
MLKKCPKKVWYDGLLWKVMDIVSPHKDEDFLILSRIFPQTVHEDESPCHEMVCVAVGDCEVYPDNPKVREAMKKIDEARQKYESVRFKYKEQLTQAWLNMCGYPYP